MQFLQLCVMTRAPHPVHHDRFSKTGSKAGSMRKGPDNVERRFTPEERRLLIPLDAPERMAAAQIVYSAGLKPGRTRF